MQETLELSRKHHVHKDRSKQKRDDQVRRSLVQYLDGADKSISVPGRHSNLSDLVSDRSCSGVEREIRRIVRVNRNLELSVEPFDSRRPQPMFYRCEIVETHLPDFGR